MLTSKLSLSKFSGTRTLSDYLWLARIIPASWYSSIYQTIVRRIEDSYGYVYRLSDHHWLSWARIVPVLWRSSIYQTIVRRYGVPVGYSPVYRLPFGFYAKYCRNEDEALTMEYVRRHTNIPVPRVVDIVPTKPGPMSDRTQLLIMKALPGTLLFINGHRLRDASPSQIAGVADTIRGWIDQLRALESPHGDKVCGFSGGPFYSYRISQAPEGPFASVSQFHSQNFFDLWGDRAPERVWKFRAERETRPYRNHLVHGDLLLHNILADESFRPTGLIDWECAGWMPEYWETASSARSAFGRMWCWKDIHREAFPRYDDDLELDLEVQIAQGL